MYARALYGSEAIPAWSTPRQTAAPFTPAIEFHLRAQQFECMDAAYRKAGGLVSGDDVALRMGEHVDQATSRLAHWIVDGKVVSLQWQSQLLVPLFQFDLRDFSVVPAVTGVLREFHRRVEARDVALWFVTPNPWLRWSLPVVAVLHEQSATLEAARADAFVARW